MTLRDPCGSSQLQDFTSKLRLGPFHHPAGLIAMPLQKIGILLILLTITFFHLLAELIAEAQKPRRRIGISDRKVFAAQKIFARSSKVRPLIVRKVLDCPEIFCKSGK